MRVYRSEARGGRREEGDRERGAWIREVRGCEKKNT